MSYEKKLKLRTLLQAIWALTGIAMIALCVTGAVMDEQAAYFGAALFSAHLTIVGKTFPYLRNPLSSLADAPHCPMGLVYKQKSIDIMWVLCNVTLPSA